VADFTAFIQIFATLNVARGEEFNPANESRSQRIVEHFIVITVRYVKM
jgi:hypothetical protein